ncbi:hypothetical protein SUDANB120_00077 [Streptomyces sp. enrichment culture]|uniref:hypothetical protein n=1 Tax=Streptomyces sp. enrichment culture TaxID=1795815 RepID=UPI003F546F83
MHRHLQTAVPALAVHPLPPFESERRTPPLAPRPAATRLSPAPGLMPQGRRRPAAGDGTPDFAALFAPRDRGWGAGDRRAGGWRPTPRTAHLLHTALVVLADQAYDDALHLAGRFLPRADPAALEVFHRLPPHTWAADRLWRRRMARAFDDLAGDLADGRRPTPTCTAEETALRLAVEDAPVHLEVLRDEADHHALPEHEDDYGHARLMLRHRDAPLPCCAACAGGQRPRPAPAAGPSTGAGGRCRAAWFTPFDDRRARDPRRGFRR